MCTTARRMQLQFILILHCIKYVKLFWLHTINGQQNVLVKIYFYFQLWKNETMFYFSFEGHGGGDVKRSLVCVSYF